MWSKHIAPVIGALPVDTLTPELLASRVVTPLEQAGKAEVARRVCHVLSSVLLLAEDLRIIAPGTSPARNLMPPAHRGHPRRALLPPMDLHSARAALAEIEAASGSLIGKLAIRFAAATVVPPDLVRAAEWSQFVGSGEPWLRWAIPISNCEAGLCRTVPLAAQAVEVLEAARMAYQSVRFVFPSPRSKSVPLSHKALATVAIRAGLPGEWTVHSWRRIFSRVMSERHPDQLVVIGACLGNSDPRMPVEAEKQRAWLLEQRAIVQEWADLLLTGFPAAGG